MFIVEIRYNDGSGERETYAHMERAMRVYRECVRDANALGLENVNITIGGNVIENYAHTM